MDSFLHSLSPEPETMTPYQRLHALLAHEQLNAVTDAARADLGIERAFTHWLENACASQQQRAAAESDA